MDPKRITTIFLVVGAIGLVALAIEWLKMRLNGWLALIVVSLILLVMALLIHPGHAHDHNRPGLNGWYQGLRSPAGSPCCDGPGVDATHLSDVDWEARGGHYRARIDGEWIDVPDDAVLPGPNMDGRTLVWPSWSNGRRAIRCFIPGSMT